MYSTKIEKIKYALFIVTVFIAILLSLAGLDWFMAGFAFGVIVGGLLFEGPLQPSRRDR